MEKLERNHLFATALSKIDQPKLEEGRLQWLGVTNYTVQNCSMNWSQNCLQQGSHWN